jgi:uncharacterized integral membrane protein (TIGR00697 family)
MNELLFIAHTCIISISALIALYLGQAALVAFVCLQCVLANLFVIKQITLFGFSATCADAFTIGAVLGLNLLQEYFGRAITRTCIWINFFLLMFYVIVSQIHIAYIPNSYDTMQGCFVSILGFMPRIVIASFLVHLIVQWVDYALYGFLKRMLRDRYLVTRNVVSIMLTQLLDTVLFSFLGLYGIIENIWQIIFISYVIKLAAIAIASPFVLLSKKIHIHHEIKP